MDRIGFQIFEPEKKKFHLTPDWMMFILWFVPALLLWIFKGDNSSPPGNLVTAYIVCVFLLTMYYLIASFFTYQPLRGVLKGEIIFDGDRIVMDEKVFELKDISKLDFQFDDYFGKKIIRGYKSVNPLLLQGVNNYVNFTDANNGARLVYFKMLGEHSYLSLAPFINDAIKMKKMNLNVGLIFWVLKMCTSK